MLLTNLQQDAVLVTDVAGRVEAALSDCWKVQGYGLRDQIESLRRRGVDRRVIKMLHDLRQWRNRVIHHPRQELPDREKFRQFSNEVLPVIEGSSGPEDFVHRYGQHLGHETENAIDAAMAQAFSDLGQPLTHPTDN
jgi:hypothetical protein